MIEQKITLKLEFSLSGKSRKPSVSFTGMGHGVPLTPSLGGKNPPDKELVKQNAAFDEFSKAAYKYCKEIKDAGELK
jgi:hypothetical protein